MTAHWTVVGAVIVRDGLIFAAQRGGHGPLAGLWEFPGGKVEPGESPEVALAREIREELRVDVHVGSAVTTTVHEYSFGVVELTTLYCTIDASEPQLSEHSDFRWLAPDELPTLEWAPADLPAVERVRADLKPLS